MFGFLRNKTRIYKAACFSFEYPGYMKTRKEGDQMVSFSKRYKPIGVFRIHKHIEHDKAGTDSKKLINKTIKELRNDGNEDYENLDFGDFSGIYHKNNNKSYDLIDTFYWGNRLNGGFFNNPKKTDLEQAIDVTRMLRMTVHYWEFGNSKIHIRFTYRHFFLQSEESDKILNEEIAKIKEIFPTIKMIG